MAQAKRTRKTSQPKDIVERIRQARRAAKSTSNLPNRGRASQAKAAARKLGLWAHNLKLRESLAHTKGWAGMRCPPNAQQEDCNEEASYPVALGAVQKWMEAIPHPQPRGPACEG